MLEYGTDKPDLRNPLRVTDVTQHFAGSGFGLFANIAASGGVVRAIPAPGTAAPRSFFDKLNEWARAKVPAASATSSTKPTARRGRSPETSKPTAPKRSARPAA